MPTKRTTIIAEADLLDRVDRCARRLGTTKTAVVAAALEAFLAEHDAPAPLAFVAIGRSGHGRLSLDARSIVRRELGAQGEPVRRVDGTRGRPGGPAPAAPGGDR